jgi:hypothetical protein
MISFKFLNLANMNFMSGLKKLANCDQLHIAVAYRIGKIIEQVESENKRFISLHQSLVAKYKVEGTEGAGAQAAREKAYKEELDALLEIEVKVGFDRIGLTSLDSVKLSPGEVMALDWLIIG